MSIIDQTVSGLPEVSWRLRDFLTPRVGRPIPEPPQAAPAAEAEAPEESAAEGVEVPGGADADAIVPPPASPLAPPAPYGHPSIADAVAAKGEPADADAEAGQ